MLSVSMRGKSKTTACSSQIFLGTSVRSPNFEVNDSFPSSVSPLTVANVKPQCDGSISGRNDVNEVLNLFREILEELKREEKLKGRPTNIKVHLDALIRLKKMHKCLNQQKLIGAIHNIAVGDKFSCRAELVAVGLHLQIQRGIDYLNENGTLLATSIVDSSLYENKRNSADSLIYSGEGGIPSGRNQQRYRDQVLEGGNLALQNSMNRQTPVRVIRKSSTSSLNSIFVYDGLFFVAEMKRERAKQHGKLVYHFHLKRISGQIRVSQGPGIKLTKTRIISDISSGKEESKIPVINEFDGQRPSEFTYIASMSYEGLQMEGISDGCDCTRQCSSSENCSCKGKNGEEIPYDNRGNLVRKSPLIFECGSSCKCSDSCFNRVTQLGRKKELEVFKTEATGWGVRSRSHIGPNTFICEFVGEIVEEMEIEPGEIIEEWDMERMRLVNNEYLFRLQNSENLTSFVIDASTKGNVARFINHSCNSNLYVQRVLYDHLDSRIPHIMLFSKQHIPPNQELTLNYNHSLGLKYHVEAKKCNCREMQLQIF